MKPYFSSPPAAENRAGFAIQIGFEIGFGFSGPKPRGPSPRPKAPSDSRHRRPPDERAAAQKKFVTVTNFPPRPERTENWSLSRFLPALLAGAFGRWFLVGPDHDRRGRQSAAWPPRHCRDLPLCAPRSAADPDPQDPGPSPRRASPGGIAERRRAPRTVAYYLSGEQPVPKTVMPAMEGYDKRRAA